MKHEVLEIKGENFVEGIRMRDLKTKRERELELGDVFVEIGLISNSEPFKGIGRLSAWGNRGELC